MEKIMIAGGGVLGSQIAFQCAYAGLDVTVWLRSEESIQRTMPKMKKLAVSYQQTIDACKNGQMKYLGALDKTGTGIDNANFSLYEEKVQHVMERIHFETNLEKASEGQDFVIESISENMETKKEFYQNLNLYISDNTVIATNTSSFLPSRLAAFIRRPERFIQFSAEYPHF